MAQAHVVVWVVLSSCVIGYHCSDEHAWLRDPVPLPCWERECGGSERGFQTWNKDIAMTLEMDVGGTFLELRAGWAVDTSHRVVCVHAMEV